VVRLISLGLSGRRDRRRGKLVREVLRGLWAVKKECDTHTECDSEEPVEPHPAGDTDCGVVCYRPSDPELTAPIAALEYRSAANRQDQRRCEIHEETDGEEQGQLRYCFMEIE